MVGGPRRLRERPGPAQGPCPRRRSHPGRRRPRPAGPPLARRPTLAPGSRPFAERAVAEPDGRPRDSGTIGESEESNLPVVAASSVQAALTAARDGGPDAIDRLVEALYPDLRRIARAQLRRLRPGRTLDTTSLVHEAYVKLVKGGELTDRAHFLAASARAMRHILVNAARRKLAAKHGGGRDPATLDGSEPADERAQYAEILDVGRALERLGQLDDRLCRLVECRFYAGMTEEETAVALDVSDRTVRRDWLRARAWLKQELGRIPAPPGGPGS